jgi:hypothetical protein
MTRNIKIIFLFAILSLSFVFALSFAFSGSIENVLHLNIQVMNSTGVATGTFNFTFNISTSSDCANVIYTNFTSLTTDSRGIISYYLEDVNLNFSDQYWLCYYRNGTLINASKIARSPYSFTTKNISAEGIKNDSNLDLTGKNITARYGLFSWLNVTGISYLGNLIINADNITFNNAISKSGNISFWNATGSELMRVTNNGNVGIGMTNPGSILEVNKTNNGITDVRINNPSTGASAFKSLEFYQGTTRQSYIAQIGSGNTAATGGASGTQIVNIVNGNITFIGGTGTTEIMRLTPSGYVGIGTTTPGQKLDVVGIIRSQGSYLQHMGSNVAGGVIWTSNLADTEYEPFSIAAETQTFKTGIAGNVIAMFINSSGNVGIGTTSPIGKLDVTGTTASYPGRVMLDDNGNYVPQIKLFKWTGSGTNYYQNTIANSADAAGALSFQTGGATGAAIGSDTQSTKMIILQGGNVGIGTTNPVQLLDIVGSTSAILQLNDSNGRAFWIGSGALVNNVLTIGDATAGNLGRLSIDSNGNVGINTTSPGEKLVVYGTNVQPVIGNRMVHTNIYGSYPYQGWTSLDINSGGSNNAGLNLITNGGNMAVSFVNMGAGTEGTNDLRLAMISVLSTGTSGFMGFYVMNAGTLNQVMTLNNTGNVGIGTASPTSKLEVLSTTVDNGIYGSAIISDPGVSHTAIGVEGIGQSKDDENVEAGIGVWGSGDHIGVNAYGWDYGIYAYSYGKDTFHWPASAAVYAFGTGGAFDFYAANATGKSYFAGKVGIGTTTPSTALQVIGIVNITGQLWINGINNTAPDYVFESWLNDKKEVDLMETGLNETGKEILEEFNQSFDNETYQNISENKSNEVPDVYIFKNLSEVKEYVMNNSHLPNMPSAEEIKKKGINVLEDRNKLLEKIEEIFIYLFGIDERVTKLENENKEMKESLCKLGEKQWC